MSQMSQPPTSAERPAVRGHQSHGSRTFSFRSNKSGGSQAKEDLAESPRDKARRDSIWKATSKANPNAAIQENQPGVNAVFEESTLAPLRSVQHRDAFGNVITDPDLSNPTRPRLERPLDTIRSFEKAIDNGYRRRSNYQRAESDSNMHQQNDRRNSAYGYDAAPSHNRYANGNGGGYYGGQRPDSMAGGPRRHPNNRMTSDSMMYNQRPYPHHAQQPSQDTGSDSTGPWANSTDPSSENSSIDRIAPPAKPYGENGYPQNGYAHNGYGPNGFQGPIPEEGGSYPMRGGAPAVQAPERRPIPLGNSGDAPLPSGSLPSTKRPEAEKRKSWLSRRFSKKN
ncbi:uncharacterized protein RCC_03525 [Ramularia collo-cygni]|uniref:DUF2406 domain protein n=1 Tax=Ramularia collo-cygni TaxID=112498 RepID=A0A2D3USD4_9PEZI|nr:uncharacterized protein RCC_03525 [Ramularia collo-cygni]CZT17688.1 uncharacterized protein RCC_03525 [Ramularia collo-cygni]